MISVFPGPPQSSPGPEMNSQLLSCGTCQEPFSQLAELRRHSRRDHTPPAPAVIPVLAREGFLSQSFSSMEEFYTRAGREERGGGGHTKRKSLFDGIQFPIRKKKKKVVGAGTKMREKSFKSSQDSPSLRKFLLMFDCKICQTKFSKLGELRRHSESAHSQQSQQEEAEVKSVKNDNEAAGTPRLAGRGQARPEAGGSRSHLEKCLDFQLDPRFKFPFGPKFQARLLQEKKIDVSRLAGFTSVPRKLPSVKPWTPC